jgi:two-component system LytT family response regulator
VKSIRVLVVDDERLARQRMKDLAAEHADLVVAGEAATGPDAVTAMESLRPDLVLLDISLPGMNGFDVLACVELDPLPLIVFTTAYDEHAIRAFEVHAVDYLLKPIERPRFAAALQHARDLLGKRDATLDDALRELVAREAHRSSRMVVRAAGRLVFIRPSEIDWVESVGNYVKIHRGAERLVVRQSLSSIEERLHDHGFVRIQRSILVNSDRVAEIRREGRESHWVVLTTGTRLRLSERHRAELERAFV